MALYELRSEKWRKRDRIANRIQAIFLTIAGVCAVVMILA